MSGSKRSGLDSEANEKETRLRCEKGESKQNKYQSTICNKLSVQKEDNIWSLPSRQSKYNKEKNQSIDRDSIKNTYNETHCISNYAQSLPQTVCL